VPLPEVIATVPPMAHEPRVAVIIPCFNDGETLGEAVASARAQTVKAQVIVVDDGSDDRRTIDAIAAVEAAGTTVVRQRNQGLSAARMAGVGASRAEYLLPLDADDRLADGALADLVARLDETADFAAAWGAYRCFGTVDYVQLTTPFLDPWQVSYQNDLPVTALFRRSALLDAGGWQLRGGYEDWDLWMALAERGWRGVGGDAVVYHYRRHGTRMLADAAGRHGAIYATLQARHASLFAARRANRRRSPAPATLKAVLPLIDALPIGHTWKRLLAGAATHFAYRRGLRLLVRRVRAGT
jgi:glycosyltransferase involved in cell wall biosynthesis